MTDWNGLPPDPTIAGYHWLQRMRPWDELIIGYYHPRVGTYPCSWEFLGRKELTKPETVARWKFRYIAPVESAPYRWVAS